jgi:hypothetical protein
VSVNGDEIVLAQPAEGRKALRATAAVAAEQPDGGPPAPAEWAFWFMAETRPAAEVMFPEVTPKPYRFWGWIQGQRVRYFPEGAPRFRAPEDALPQGASPASPEEP